MTTSAKGRERRRSRRLWVRSPGQVTVLRGMRGTRSLACTILNKSHGGALIRLERAADVPDDFYLTFDDEPSRKIVCSVIRRSKQLLAVRYTQQTNVEIRVLRLTTA